MTNETLNKPSDLPDAPITAKVADAAHNAVDNIAASSARLEKNASQGSAAALEQAEEIARHARESGQDYLDKASHFVHEHPIQALGIAFASGYVVSRLMSK